MNQNSMNRNIVSTRIKTIVIIAFTFVILCTQSAFSQVNLPDRQTGLDSLWNVWNDPNQPDTIRLEAMHKIARYGYLYSQPDSAFYFAQLGYDFAESKGLKKQMSGALNTQGNSLHIQSDYTRALDYYTRSLAIREVLGDQEGIAISLNNIGLIYYNQGDYARTIDYYTKSLTISEEIGDKLGIAISLSNIGIVYWEKGDYARAIDYFTRSLTISEEIKDMEGIASSLNNIGIIYKDQGDYASAIDYYIRSLTIREEQGDKKNIASNLYNIGNVYNEQGDHTRALDYFTRGLTIDEELGDKNGIAFSLNKIGSIYFSHGDYDSALDYYTRSLIIKEELGDKKGIASNLSSIGLNYMDQGDYASAIEYGKRALTIGQEIGVLTLTRDAAKALYSAYKSIGRNKLSLEMYELYIATKDSINSEENQKEVIRQKYKYDYDKKAIADSVTYVQVKKVQEAKLEKSRILQFSLLGGIVLLVAFLMYVFNRFRITRKQKLLISKQNEELTVATQKAESANSELKTKSEELEKFNAVMLDREMRIIELKKEANKLAITNDTDIPYPEVEDV